MTVSIIIAVKDYCGNLKECVDRCRKLDFSDKDYEIWVLSDIETLVKKHFHSLANIKPSVNIFATGDITPPYKRDLGAKRAKGEILAFLDDDAYPCKDWLKEAVKIFEENHDIGCVCGPGVTPENDSLEQKASGLVYGSLLVSGNHGFRYAQWPRREVLDFPSCNFLIRKELFDEIGGFDKPYWPGEDTFLCLKVLKTGKKMVYSPEVLVYHHRRALFKEHLGQIKNYAFHRGYFAKKYPRTSFKPEYFIPSIFAAGLIAAGVLSLFSPLVKAVYLSLLAVYFVFVGVSSFSLVFKEKGSFFSRSKLFFLTVPGVFLTHIVYGLFFVKGLLVQKMPEEK